MNNNTFLLKQMLIRYNGIRSRSQNTKRGQHSILKDIADLLTEQFKLKYLINLKQKHIQFIIQTWEKRDYKQSTMTTKIGFLRKFCLHIGKVSCIGSNQNYGVKRGSVVFVDKRWTQNGKDDFTIINTVTAEFHKNGSRILDVLKLQRLFGLRKREALKYVPFREIIVDDKGNPIRIELTLGTKNGRFRTIPVRTDAQRSFLKNLLITYKTNPINPYPRKQYKRFEREYFYILERLGIKDGRTGHGLRQAYANDRLGQLLEEISNKAQITGLYLTDEEILLQAYRELTQELGHGRIDILKSYLADFKYPILRKFFKRRKI